MRQRFRLPWLRSSLDGRQISPIQLIFQSNVFHVMTTQNLIFFVIALLFKLFFFSENSPAQLRQPSSAPQIVNEMVQSEAAAWKNRQHFMYRKEERSNRTRGHLWGERVVETSDGPMERLISIDGKPLSGSRARAEDKRITYLANHPDEFRRQTRRRNEDEARMPSLLRELAEIFVFSIKDAAGDSARVAFQPNPSFQEKTYQDRVVHAMSGVLLIQKADRRLSELDARLDHKVEFGYGLLGEVSDKTNFSLARKEVFPGYWEPTKIHVHLDGTVLLLKSISRDVESSENGFRLVPHDLTVAQAAAILRSSSF